MKVNEPLFSIKEKKDGYVFNIYCYQGKLVGIEEDPAYLQLFEMEGYGSPSDYFDWRMTKIGFGYLLDVKGNALLKEHPSHRIYRAYMQEARRTLKLELREWRNRVRK
ncbi:hypothetical protein [Enterococcus sp. DIV0756]|uniref:hypothetical protein n=1 Tax=Enterococcus sp. DIV0756 TaxID=2774636 RepID=UPI003F27B52F